MPKALVSTYVNLPQSIRHRINELLKMKLTPSTINLMIKDILLNNDFKHNVVKYINIMLEKELININKIKNKNKKNESNYSAVSVHKNQKIDNLLNLQKIFLSRTNENDLDQQDETKTLNFEILRKSHRINAINSKSNEDKKIVNEKQTLNSNSKNKVDLVQLFKKARTPNKLSNTALNFSSKFRDEKENNPKMKSDFTRTRIIKKIANSISSEKNHKIDNEIDYQAQKEKLVNKARESVVEWNEKKLINKIFRYGRQIEIIDNLNVNMKIKNNNSLEELNYLDDDIKSMPDLEINDNDIKYSTKEIN